MNQRNKYLPTGESSFPRMPLEKKCKYPGPGASVSSNFLLKFQKQQELLHYAIHESCPHTDIVGSFFFFFLSVREELLFLCQRQKIDRDGTSNGDIITHRVSGALLTWLYNFLKIFASQSIRVYGRNGLEQTSRDIRIRSWSGRCLKLDRTSFKGMEKKWSSFGQCLPHVANLISFEGWDDCLWRTQCSSVSARNRHLCLSRLGRTTPSAWVFLESLLLG